MSYRTLTLKKQYTFNGSFDDLVIKIEKLEGVTVRYEGIGHYRLSADYSLGTSRSCAGIYTEITIVPVTDDIQTVCFSTNIRTEHIVVAIVFLVVVIINHNRAGFEALQLLLMMCLWFFIHAWLHFLYRTQETELVKKMVLKLGLHLSI